MIMERFRTGAHSLLVKIILTLIMLSFIFAGFGSYITSSATSRLVAAKVGDTQISLNDFENAFQHERNRLQNQLGDYATQLLADETYLETFRRSVLESLVDKVLLDQFAASLSLNTSDKQISDTIVSLSEFKVDNKFDLQTYQASLRRAGFTPDSFAQYIKVELMRSQIIDAIKDSSFTLDNEIDSAVKLLNQQRQISTITLDTQLFAKDIKPDDDEINAYYVENQTLFTEPEKMQISYINLATNQLRQNIVISDEQVKEYYDAKLDLYMIQATRKVAHILFADEKIANEVLQNANLAQDFAKLAKQYSQDAGSSDNGGDLGWIQEGTMDPTFELAAFALKNIGDTSPLIKSDFGYHIIKLVDKTDQMPMPFDQVEDAIKEVLADDQAINEFYSLKTKLEQLAFEYPESLEKVATDTNLKINTTKLLAINDLPEILNNPAIIKELLTPTVKEDKFNSNLIEIDPENVMIVRIDKISPAMVLTLDEVSPQVIANITQEQAKAKTEELAKELIKELQETTDEMQVTKLLEKHKLTFSDKLLVDRNSTFTFTNTNIFALPKPKDGETVYSSSVNNDGNIEIIALHSIAYNITEMEKSKGQIKQQLNNDLWQQDITNLIASLRANNNIEYLTK